MALYVVRFTSNPQNRQSEHSTENLSCVWHICAFQWPSEWGSTAQCTVQHVQCRRDSLHATAPRKVENICLIEGHFQIVHHAPCLAFDACGVVDGWQCMLKPAHLPSPVDHTGLVSKLQMSLGQYISS